MSTLRRRIFGGTPPSSDPSRDNSPSRGEELHVVPAKKLKKLVKSEQSVKGSKRQKLWLFGLGGVFGVAIAAFFAGGNEMIDLKALSDMNLDSIFDVLPAGLIKDAQNLQVCLWCKEATPDTLMYPLTLGTL